MQKLKVFLGLLVYSTLGCAESTSFVPEDASQNEPVNVSDSLVWEQVEKDGGAHGVDDSGSSHVLKDGAMSDEGVDAVLSHDEGAFGDSKADAPVPPYIIPPIKSCAPKGNACSPGLLDKKVYATYRKDFYLPAYMEVGDAPLTGGRFQIAAISQATGQVTSVKVDGVDIAKHLEDQGIQFEQNQFEWFHVWPTQAQAGQPIWVAFHSRNGKWDKTASAQLRIETSGGVAVDQPFAVKQTKVPLTYITTSADQKTLLIHLKNTDAVKHTVKRILVDGHDVLAANIACVPTTLIPAGQTELYTVPFCTPKQRGEAWTVVVEFENAAPAVGAGRILRPFFPIESYNNTDECRFPGGNTGNYNSFRAAGFDTVYLHGGSGNECKVDLYKLINNVIPNTAGLYTLASDGLVSENFTNTDGILGWETGDESDGKIYIEDNASSDYGKPAAWNKAKNSDNAWAKYPMIATFNGAKTNKNVGTFAGIADIQGIDFYVGACAPHITQIFTKFEIYTSFDYLKNARNNHMPLTTWFYAQGLHGGWNAKQPVTNFLFHVQPDPQEILVQGMSVLNAGGKGLMWFQINADEAQYSPARWKAISDLNWMVRGVREYVREGDITGMVSASPDILVEMIRSRQALIVPLINIKVFKKVDDQCNALKFVSEAALPHWVLDAFQTTFSIVVPDDFGAMEVFEVRDRKTISTSFPVLVNGRTLTFKDVPLNNDLPVRLFVVAANKQVRATVEQKMK